MVGTHRVRRIPHRRDAPSASWAFAVLPYGNRESTVGGNSAVGWIIGLTRSRCFYAHEEAAHQEDAVGAAGLETTFKAAFRSKTHRHRLGGLRNRPPRRRTRR